MRQRPLLDRPWLVGALVSLGALAAYSAVVRFDFLRFDDDFLVFENRMVRSGLSWASVRWALTDTWAFWAPLTRLSHLVDSAVWGPRPGGHHLTNALLHALNTGLAFTVFRQALGRTGRAALLAGLFALHPLNVEVVAWVSERKELLCGTFFLGAVSAYLATAARPRPKALALVTALFAAALMAKSTALTLPAVLLLLDGWPLGRLARDGRVQWRCVVEKLPMVALAAAFSALTYFAQADIGATGDGRTFPLDVRLANAVVSAARYLELMAAPASLSPFYPHPYGSLSAWKVAGAAAALAALGALALRLRRTRPHLLVGLLWWAGMLLPVIGLVQIGRQAMADRYMYLPMLGLLLALGAEAARWRLDARWIDGALAGLLVGAGVVMQGQLRCWADTETLFLHAREVTPGTNWTAEATLAGLRQRSGDVEGAIASLRLAVAALEADPLVQARLWQQLLVLLPGPERAQASAALEKKAAAAPHDPGAQVVAAAAAAATGRWDEAVARYQIALQLEPRYRTVRRALEAARARQLPR